MKSLSLQQLTEKLVSFKTVSDEDSTAPIANFISEYLEDRGFIIERYPYTTKQQVTEGIKAIDKINLIARKGGQESKMALAGHMDTVPFEEDGWQSNPLQLTPRLDRFYGRGTADMKTFLAVAIKAGEAIKAHELKHPFALCFTSDEEKGCLGAKKLVKEARIADLVVVGEPTEMQPINLHKGYIYFAPELYGKGGHASVPSEGSNVIELALPSVINNLLRIKEKLKAIKDDRFSPPYATMNIGVVSQGKEAAKNKIADFCKIELEIRPLPNQNIEEIRSVVSYVLNKTVSELDGITINVKLARAPTPPMETPSENSFVRLIEKISRQKSKSACFNTEGGLYNQKGSQTVIWGPGSIKQAHESDEFIEAKWMQSKVVEQYIQLIKKICC